MIAVSFTRYIGVLTVLLRFVLAGSGLGHRAAHDHRGTGKGGGVQQTVHVVGREHNAEETVETQAGRVQLLVATVQGGVDQRRVRLRGRRDRHVRRVPVLGSRHRRRPRQTGAQQLRRRRRRRGRQWRRRVGTRTPADHTAATDVRPTPVHVGQQHVVRSGGRHATGL